MPRSILAAAAAALLVCPALAQQRSQGRPPAQARPAQAQPPAQAPGPALFPCRTEKEVCYIGVVVGSQLAILFTNAPGAETMEPKPITVFSDAAGSGGEAPAKLDLAQHEGRVVMLTGEYDPKVGLTKAELVDVASPLLSFALKSQVSGQEEPAPQSPSGKPPARSPRR